MEITTSDTMKGLRRTATTLLVLVFAVAVSAQSRTSGGGGLLGFTKEQLKAAHAIAPAKKQVKQKKDYALYLSLTKRNGWFVGVGPQISDEEATYHSCYYKLSEKNPAGNWTHVEALDAYGNLTTNHNIQPIALPSSSDSDDDAVSDWVEKLGNACQWNFTYDGHGEHVIMETSYDANGNTLCMFQPVQINDSTVIGIYMDDLGRPANLRKNETGATLVRLTTDKNGYISLIELLDGNGKGIKNSNGVYARREEHDKDGFLIEHYSVDPWGKMMIDKALNSGMHNVWDKERGVILESISFNDKHEYEKMPARDISDENIARVVYDYDKHNREISETYYNVDGTKDTIQMGLHRVEYSYNRHGKWVEINKYGMDGKLHNDDVGVARLVRKMNDKGGLVHWSSYDQNGLPVVAEGNSYAMQDISYEADGKTIKEYKIYAVEDGQLVLEVHYQKQGDTSTYIWRKEDVGLDHPRAMYKYYEMTSPTLTVIKHMCGITKVDSMDTKGNIVSSEFRDSLNRLIVPPNSTYAAFTNRFSYDGDSYEQMQQYYDAEGKLTGARAKQYKKYVADSDETLYMEWDENNLPYNFYWSSSEKLDSPWKQYVSPLGVPSRTEYDDGICCYKTTEKRDVNGNPYAWGAVNEWGEPAYVTFNQGKRGYLQNNNRTWHDEHSNEIGDTEDWALRIPKALSIECIDPKAFDFGFRDNDIIVQYGDYYYPIAGEKDIEDLLLALAVNAGKEKVVRVLRHDVANKRSEIVTLPLGKGKLSDFGVAEHIILYTTKELARLIDTVLDFGKNEEWKTNAERRYGKDNIHSVCLIMPCKKYGSELYYKLGVKDVHVVINSLKDQDSDNVTYTFSDDFANVQILSRKEVEEGEEDYRKFHITLTDEEYELFETLYK